MLALSLSRYVNNVSYSHFLFASLLVFFLYSASLCSCPHHNLPLRMSSKSLFQHRGKVTVHGQSGRPWHSQPVRCFLGRPQGLGWLREGRRSPRERGWADGALQPGLEGRSDGPIGSPVLRWVLGQEVMAGGPSCLGGQLQSRDSSGDGDKGRTAVVHTACGRSESKHLRPTPVGHVEGSPVIALCWPGSPRQAGRGPVSRDSGHSASPRSRGRGIGQSDAPSPRLPFPVDHSDDPNLPPVPGTVEGCVCVLVCEKCKCMIQS